MAKLKLHKISKVEANNEGQQILKKHAAAAVKAKNWFSHKINYAQQQEKLVFPTKLIFLDQQEIPKSSSIKQSNLKQIVRQQIALIYDPISYYQLDLQKFWSVWNSVHKTQNS